MGALPFLKLHPNLLTGLLIFLGASACSSLPEKTGSGPWPFQVTKYEASSFDSVFRAFKNVLQEEGYLLTRQDANGGVIVAEVGQKATSGGVMLGQLRAGRVREIVINVWKIPDGKTVARLSLQLVRNYTLGGSDGDEIVEEPFYDEIFSLVKAELGRRERRRPDSKPTK